MSQPPDEPPEPAPDEPWQAPGPPSSSQYPSYPYPYGQPPQQNPYGGDPNAGYRPLDSGGMPSVVKVVLGVVLGLCGGFVLWFMTLIGFAGAGAASSDTILVLAALAPLIVPAPLLIWPVTRPWATGLLIGTAISSIGLSSLCSALFPS